MAFKKIRFVTDSTSDIAPELVEKWQITVIPAFVNYGGRSYADDGIEIRREDYYTQMLSMKEVPTTAAPSSGLAEERIRQAFEDADHLMMLTAPAKLSGIYNAFRLGASALPPERVTLIDSGMVSAALGWQVILGAEVAAETGDVQKVLDAIARVRAHQKLYAVPATLEFLRRSGRVGWARASIGAVLQIKPIIEVVDGEVISAYRVRTFSKAIEKMAELSRAAAPLDRVTIIHSNNLEGVEELKRRLSDILPSDCNVTLVNPAVGTHIGPSALGIALVSQKWRT